jgi:spermidine synthase
MIVLSVGLALLAMSVLFGDLLRVRRAAAGSLSAALLLAALLVPAPQVAAYGCFGDGVSTTGDCLGRSLRDGWEQAVDSGCLRETNYYCIKVHDQVVSSGQVLKTLVLDHLVHSYNSLEDPSYLHYAYIKVYAEVADYLARRLPNQGLEVLYIGGGGYTLARHIEATYPNARQDVIEIDPGVTQTAYEKLGVDPNRTRIVTYNLDGRLMINQLAERLAGRYDLIIGDAFNDLSIPYHLTTREFDQKLKGLLKGDGYYLALVIDKLRGGKFIPAYTGTVRQVWPYVYILADGNSWESSAASTYVVAAGNYPLDFARLQQVRGQGPAGRTLTGIMPADVMDRWLAEARPPVLTDDYAPVDNLIAPVFAERGF